MNSRLEAKVVTSWNNLPYGQLARRAMGRANTSYLGDFSIASYGMVELADVGQDHP